jgi:hypothetical protein
MKFLCVACDEPMKLIEAKPPERGSLSVLFRCPACENEIAMLTNPFETQVVGSLGVQIGGESGDTDGASGCPFSGVVQEMGLGSASTSGEVSWSSEAAARLENMPEFARPMAKSGIEKFAKDRGLSQVDLPVLDQAKEFFGM